MIRMGEEIRTNDINFKNLRHSTKSPIQEQNNSEINELPNPHLYHLVLILLHTKFHTADGWVILHGLAASGSVQLSTPPQCCPLPVLGAQDTSVS